MKLIERYLLTLVLMVSLVVLVLPATRVFAAGNCPGQAVYSKDSRVCCPINSQDSARDCFFAKYLNPTIYILSAIASLAVVIGIIIGGIQYSASGGDPQKVAAGKAKIIKSLYGLLAFLFLFSALAFLSPGGIGTTNSGPVGSGSRAKQCSRELLGLEPWFAYLPPTEFGGDTGCDIVGFSLFGSSGTGKGSDLLPVLLVVVDDLVRVAALIAVGFVITGGISLITSQGQPDKTKRARDTVLNALIGLAIAIVATAVVSYVGSQLSK